MPAHVHADMETYIHTCMYACIHTCIHTYKQKYLITYTLARAHTHAHARAHRHMYTYIFIYLHATYYMYTYTRVCVHTYTRTQWMQSQWLEGDRVLILHAMESVLAWPLQMAQHLKFYISWGERACGWKRGAVSAWVRDTFAGGRDLVAVGFEGWETWTTGGGRLSSSEARSFAVRCGDEAVGAEADVHASAHATCRRQTGSSGAWRAAAWCALLHACMYACMHVCMHACVFTHTWACVRAHTRTRDTGICYAWAS